MLHIMGAESEQAKGANGMQLCVVDCIAYIVDAETDECLRVYAYGPSRCRRLGASYVQ